MVYLIWGIIGILALAFKRNSIVTAVVFCFIAIIFIYVDGTKIPDYSVYQYMFENKDTTIATEPLYNFLSGIFFDAGFSYRAFRAVCTIIPLLLITRTFYKLSPYPTLALFLYSVYPMSLDVIQIRFFIGYSIVFWGAGYLLQFSKTEKLKGLIIFFLSVALGSGFHYGCMLFAVLALSVFFNYQNRFIFLCVIPFVIVFLTMTFDRFAAAASSFIGGHKADLWVGRERIISSLAVLRISVSRGLPMLFSLLLSVLYVNSEYCQIWGESTNCLNFREPELLKNSARDLTDRPFYDISVNGSLFICILYIYLFFVLEIRIEGSYERLARLGLIISTVLITRELEYLEENNRIIGIVFFLIMYFIYFATIMFFMRAGSESKFLYINFVFRSVMNNNFVFGMLH